MNERNELSGKNTYLYHPEISSPSCGPRHYGVRVAFSIKASLGTSPISSVPYVVSLFAPLTVGTATHHMHCVFILLQILILRKKYHPIQLMQLPVAFFFGYLTDFGVWAVQGITCDHICSSGWCV